MKETNKKDRERQRKREREREIVHQLARIPVYFKKSRGAEILSISYFSSSSDFRLPPSKISNWGAHRLT